MATRLDRLLLLLDTGSTPVTRKAAAEQLGQVQKLHPHELGNLLSRVHAYLINSSWDTRIAASEAIAAIACKVPQWRAPVENPNEFTDIKKEPGLEEADGRLSFAEFDITQVLGSGTPLLASSGREFEQQEEWLEGMTNKEKIAKQRKVINQRLGLSNLQCAGEFGIDHLLDDEDFQSSTDNSTKDGFAKEKENGFPLANYTGKEMQNQDCILPMSSRERNREKRRAKILAKQTSKEFDTHPDKDDEDSSNPAKKLRRLSSVVVEQPGKGDRILVESHTDMSSSINEGDWPFENFCSVLGAELFDPSWEVRHGAASALREIIKYHGGGAGKNSYVSMNQLDEANRLWLEDMAIRLICVLALDRFGDYASDEVVAPVRETCAQALGCVLQTMANESVHQVMKTLVALQKDPHWHVRHGSLLGFKYLVAVKQDMLEEILPHLLPWVKNGLGDIDDNVRSVSAETLIPATELIITKYKAEVPILFDTLWSILIDPSDLTASTNNVMKLLSSFIHFDAIYGPYADLSTYSNLIPRLWPFLKHNNTSVRKETLKMIHNLLSICNNNKQKLQITQKCLVDQLSPVYERVILDPMPDIISLVDKVWNISLTLVDVNSACIIGFHHFHKWLALLCSPPNLPISKTFLLETEESEDFNTNTSEMYIGGTLIGMSPKLKDIQVAQSQITGARLIGALLHHLFSIFPTSTDMIEQTLSVLVQLLRSASSVERLCSGMVISHLPAGIKEEFIWLAEKALVDNIIYSELSFHHLKLQSECQAIAVLFQRKAQEESIMSLDEIYNFISTSMQSVETLPQNLVKPAKKRLQILSANLDDFKAAYSNYHVRVQVVMAGIVVFHCKSPFKLNPVIKPLMEGIKNESNGLFQEFAADVLAKLVFNAVERKPSPNPKVVKHISTSLCCNPDDTPPIDLRGNSFAKSDSEFPFCNISQGILHLQTQQKKANALLASKKERSLPSSKTIPEYRDAAIAIESKALDESFYMMKEQQRGAKLSILSLCKIFKEDLQEKLPSLWKCSFGVVKESAFSNLEEESTYTNADQLSTIIENLQSIVNALQIIEVILPVMSLHEDMTVHILLSKLQQLLNLPCTAIRHMAARQFGLLATLHFNYTMEFAIRKILPFCDASHLLYKRQGATEAIAYILEHLDVKVVPYMVMFVLPMLGCMSDFDSSVRLLSTNCFAKLVQLMPLEAGTKSASGMALDLVKRREDERNFVDQLLDTSKIEQHHICVPIQAELRKYQKDGVNWLAFLNKYKLHGILCDDMGLGKTLQSICILASDHATLKEKMKPQDRNWCASLVVCPSTLTSHWCYEIEKFCDKEFLSPLNYSGTPAERMKLQEEAKKHNLIIASYDIVRNDASFFLKYRWNYCILDEGHIIKNSKTKLSSVIRQLEANHRLILSGTPIQNNVLELWSLFDFLMPGFLGTEKQFMAKFGRAIFNSRDAKSNSTEQEAGVIALESLHRQVLPFLLRRLKEDVLQDLPPKIIQDYYCSPSDLQIKLYEDFSSSSSQSDTYTRNTSREAPDATKSPHVFQALQYLKKVCNHPALVLNEKHPHYTAVMERLKAEHSTLRDIKHSSKLVALRQLLHDCGIGQTQSSMTNANPVEDVVSQHRALIFCQLKSMLDFIENDLFKKHLPSVSYLRLDGSVPSSQRHGIVQRFNDDPSIDILLLTTHVGGLGLNLTGADTVIFVEHDWNPMKDLQAMDRAHRIGQKKVVNVYRLITKGTLEEKIMGLQKFKLGIANSVLTQDNSSLQAMDTGQLFDLFTIGTNPGSGANPQDGSSSDKTSSTRNLLSQLDDLWDTSQYENEYDLNSFIDSLGAANKE